MEHTHDTVFVNLGSNLSYNSRSDLMTSGTLSQSHPILSKEVRMGATPLSSLIRNSLPQSNTIDLYRVLELNQEQTWDAPHGNESFKYVSTTRPR